MAESSDNAWRERVVAELTRGNKIAAIKHYRDGTGASLKDAKDFVEALELTLQSGNLPAAELPGELQSELLQRLRADKYLDAVAHYRRATGCSLGEAAQAVDRLASEHGLKTPRRIGCGAGILLLAVGATLVAALA